MAEVAVNMLLFEAKDTDKVTFIGWNLSWEIISDISLIIVF